MRKIILLLVLSISPHVYSQWITLNSGISQNLNALHFINTQTGFACGVNGTIIKTTNGGMNWTALVTGSSVELRSIQFLNASTGLVCGFSGTILRTTNGGTNWISVTSGTTNHLLGLSFYNEVNGVCVGNSGTTLYTTNGGISWLIGNPTGYMVTFYSAFMLNAATGYCAGVNTIFSPLFAKTTNSGANWIYSSFYLNNNEGTLRDIHFDSLKGIAVSNVWDGQGAISRTTNGGVNWTTQLFATGLYGVDFPVPSTGYTAGVNGLIMKSIDGGISWVQQISGTSVFLTSVDFTDSVNGYIAGYSGVILKTTNGGMVGIEPVSNELTLSFSLSQNYPNPFNPTTKIRFEIPLSSKILLSGRGVPGSAGRGVLVKLVIYDLLGREVEQLLNEELQPGTYEVNWDGNNYPSGVYFYRLITQDFSESKRMVLLK
ncbi:MAG: T9SS C-terminal target domain-containing protein [Ignavibacteriae bacterium]|nr:MAG: T9SS C-terminal target domain-containing protein [Ignavibacteriota bacterium]